MTNANATCAGTMKIIKRNVNLSASAKLVSVTIF